MDKEKKSLNAQNVISAVRNHRLINKELTPDQISRVFEAYSEIAQRGTFNGYNVMLPYLCQFKKTYHRGWKGRTLKVNPTLTKGAETRTQYYEGKKPYFTMEFAVKPQIQTAFKEKTRQ